MTIPPAAGKIRPAALVCLAALAAGCGSPQQPTGDVTGKVTIKGKAPNVEGLTINFLGANGLPVGARVAADGTFRAVGVSEGENKVAFSVPPPDIAAKSGKPAREGGVNKAEEAAGQTLRKLIPPKYLDHTQANLTVTVTPGGENPFTVDLK